MSVVIAAIGGVIVGLLMSHFVRLEARDRSAALKAYADTLERFNRCLLEGGACNVYAVQSAFKRFGAQKSQRSACERDVAREVEEFVVAELKRTHTSTAYIAAGEVVRIDKKGHGPS